MIRYLWMVLWLWAAVASSTTFAVVDEEGCKRNYGAGNPEGVIKGWSACDRYMNIADGTEYEFRGTAGATTGWVLTSIERVRCGDGIINQASEQCDGTQLGSCTACDTGTCLCIVTPTCGNGAVETGETCDPPNFVGVAAGCPATQICAADCLSCNAQSPPVCGNSSVDAPEVCDPPFEEGGCTPGQICNSNCTACGTCGNGQLDGIEVCDPGDSYSASSDGIPAPSDVACRTRCQGDCSCPTPVCPNGVWELGEACEAGVSDPDVIASMSCAPGDCTGTCKCNCGPEASGGPAGGTCGNGQLDIDCIGLQGSGLGDDETCETAGAGSGGAFGQAISFDNAGWLDSNGGSSSYNYSTTADLIVGFWITPRDISAQQFVFWRYGTVAPNFGGYTVGMVSPGKLQVWTADAGAQNNCVSADNALTINNTHHVWVAIDGSAGTCSFRVLNLTQGETTHTTKNGADLTVVTTPAGVWRPRLGANNAGTSQLNATVDDLRVYVGRDVGTFDYEADYNQEVSCNVTNLVGYWKFNEGTGSTTVNCVTSQVANDTPYGNAAWHWVDSPANSGSVLTCAAGQTCNDITCQCETDIQTGPTVYISPSGNDTNDGRSAATPVLTFGRARALIGGPGYTLELADGTYTIATTGLPHFIGSPNGGAICGGGTGTVPCGTQASPITIKAKNERQAWLQTEGDVVLGGSTSKSGSPSGSSMAGVKLERLEWWRVEGLRISGTGADGSDKPFASAGQADGQLQVSNSSHIYIGRNLVRYSNRYGNTAGIWVVYPRSDVIVEYNEVYDIHRHGIACYGGTGCEVRYNYVDSRDRADLPGCVSIGAQLPNPTCGPNPCCSSGCTVYQGCPNWNDGDEGVVFYTHNNATAYSNIVRRHSGYQNHGGSTSIGATGDLRYGGSFNRFFGNIAIDVAGLGSHSGARTIIPYAARDNLFVHHLVIGGGEDSRLGYHRSASGITVLNSAYIGATTWGGLWVDEQAGNRSCSLLATDGFPCKVEIRNVSAFNNVEAQDVLISSQHASNCIARGLAIDSGAGGYSLGGCTNTTDLANTQTFTGYGKGASESAVFVPSTATGAYATGEASPLAYGRCWHATAPTSAYRPCNADTDCAGSDTCKNDKGPNLLTRWYNTEQTSNAKCTGNLAPWPCCTGSATGHCELWAQQAADCGGVSCVDTAACDNTHVTGPPPILPRPTCKDHFIGCGVITTDNDINGSSCFDVHEEPGLNLDVVSLPAIP